MKAIETFPFLPDSPLPNKFDRILRPTLTLTPGNQIAPTTQSYEMQFTEALGHSYSRHLDGDVYFY